MQPILFTIGTVTVPAYPLLLSLAFVIGAIIALPIAKKRMIPAYRFFGLIVLIQVSSAVGSRILYVLNNFSQFESDLSGAFRLAPGGFDFTGGFILSLIASAFYIKMNHLSFGTISDCLVPSFAVGVCLTKIGCFLSGCCYGREISTFPGVCFPSHSPAAQHYGNHHLVHPTQLYEAFSALIILAASALLIRQFKKNNKTFDGQWFLLFTILYLFARTINESLRGDAVHDYVFALTQTQFLNILLILPALGIYRLKTFPLSKIKRKRYE